MRTFFDGERLRSIPAKRKARVAVLLELLRRFEPGRRYAEREVNDILRHAHPDVALLRRDLTSRLQRRLLRGQRLGMLPSLHAPALQQVLDAHAARGAQFLSFFLEPYWQEIGRAHV